MEPPYHSISEREIKKGQPSYKKTMKAIRDAKARYFSRMKKLHPNYIPIVTKKSLKNMLYHGAYSCISAGPNKKLDPEGADESFYKKRTEALRKDLDRLGVKYTEIIGFYDDEEPSFLISHTLDAKAYEAKKPNAFMVSRHTNHCPQEDLIRKLNALGAKYNQDSVAHSRNGVMELHYTTGDNIGLMGVCRNTQVLNGHPKDANYYSEARLGKEDYTMWSCDASHLFSEDGEIIKERLIKNPYA